MNAKSYQFSSCLACSGVMAPYIDEISDDRYAYPGKFAILQCKNCGYMSTNPVLKDEDLPSLYSNFYPRSQVNINELVSEARKVLSPLAKYWRWMSGTDNQGHYQARPGQKVLDIGSGSCLSLLELKYMGVDASGIEADPTVQSIADQLDLHIYIGSIHDYPFKDRTFDLIVLNQVIEHVPDPLSLLNSLRERLNPGGKVILSFPNSNSIQAKLSGVKWINWHVPYHQHHFNIRSFSLLAQKAEYKIGLIRTITPNLWTTLQLLAIKENLPQGTASKIWNSSSAGVDNSPSLATKLKRKSLSFLSRFITMSLVLCNRVIDAAGKGDSILIELHRSDRH